MARYDCEPVQNFCGPASSCGQHLMEPMLLVTRCCANTALYCLNSKAVPHQLRAEYSSSLCTHLEGSPSRPLLAKGELVTFIPKSLLCHNFEMQ